MTDNHSLIQRAAKLLKRSKQAIALTGAGVSTESGIPDFRSKDGLWSRFDPMEYGTIGAFRHDPQKVWKMLAELIGISASLPNKGHLALSRLEKTGCLKSVITQNIDMLHQKAGSHNVVEFHGSIASFVCLDCQNSYPLEEVLSQKVPPACKQCQSLLKPDIVFFDEQIPAYALTKTQELIAKCDLLIVAGTSCQVVPASMIPAEVHSRGGTIIEINKEPALGDMPEVVLAGGFSKIMEAIVSEFEKL